MEDWNITGKVNEKDWKVFRSRLPCWCIFIFLHTGMVFYAVLCYTASGFFADSYLQRGPHIMILVSLSEDSKQYGFTE